MKKLTLIMVCALLLVFFIAFNYLLWERQAWERDIENLRNANIYNSSQIKALEKRNEELEKENKGLMESIAKEQKDKQQLETTVQDLEKQISEMRAVVNEKELLVDRLKELVDVKIFEEPVRQWVEAINHGKYEEAYGLMDLSEDNGNLFFRSLTDFSQSFQENIKSMDIKSIELANSRDPVVKPGTVVLKVTLQVDMLETLAKKDIPFTQGSNEMYFVLECRKNSNDWLIADILKKV